MSELRFYTFVNFYLSSLQQGVQSFHVCHEMFMKYKVLGDAAYLDKPLTSEVKQLIEWADHHKTVIVLNGGANQDILDKYLFLSRETGAFNFTAPFASFSEDDYSLGGVMTAVGIVLPEEIYNAVDQRNIPSNFETLTTEAFYFIKDGDIKNIYPKNCPEWRLISMLKSCSLAR